MKKALSIAILLIVPFIVFAQPAREAVSDVLTVYCYDAFASDWGPGPSLIPRFEEETGIKVNLVSAGDAVEMVTRLKMEGDTTPADVVLGITDDFAYKAYDLLESYDSPVLKDIPDELEFDSEHRLLPFDYGDFAFVWDSESGIRKPESLEDLTKDEYRKKVILIDPRTSSVGLGLLMWTSNQFGDQWSSWWLKMKDNALTIADGWSSAYGLFTEGEAPIVLSYTTSPVYHVMNDNTTRYQALIFPEGHQATIEGVGIMKGAKNRENAEKFIDFILTEGQEDLAVMNSMYPVNSTTVLPDAFDYAPKPAIMFKSGTVGPEKEAELVEKWTEVMTK